MNFDKMSLRDNLNLMKASLNSKEKSNIIAKFEFNEILLF